MSGIIMLWGLRYCTLVVLCAVVRRHSNYPNYKNQLIHFLSNNNDVLKNIATVLCLLMDGMHWLAMYSMAGNVVYGNTVRATVMQSNVMWAVVIVMRWTTQWHLLCANYAQIKLRTLWLALAACWLAGLLLVSIRLDSQTWFSLHTDQTRRLL